jgi:putative peptide zinc metalloprotease protein
LPPRAPGAGSNARSSRDRDASSSGRIDLLRAIPGWEKLSPEVLSELGDEFSDERFAAGATVFEEGEPADRLFIVVTGEAELSTVGTKGRVPLAVMQAGDLVGELAFFSTRGRRNATLTALSELRLTSLGYPTLQRLLNTTAEMRTAFEDHATRMEIARFITQVGPFMTLSDDKRKWLAGRVRRSRVPGGIGVIRQGDRGGSCFLLHSGSAEIVIQGADGAERRVDTIAPGTMVGEAALLTDAPRCATVRTLEPSEFLVLDRSDLLQVMGEVQGVSHELVQVFRLRERPRRAEEVIVAERETADGERLTVLKNPSSLTYFRLSELGRFVWPLLDGRNNLRDLTLSAYKGLGQFAPTEIADLVAGLVRTNMIETRAISTSVTPLAFRPTRAQRALSGARRILEKQIWIRDIDDIITAMYRGGIRFLFTRPAQALLAAVALAGLVAFGLLASGAHQALSGSHKELLLLVIPGFLVGLFLHECGHAFSVKAFGRQVNRAGVGWYWFGPVAFVDTSDMWLGSRRERILVSLAGPYTDMVVAGAVSLIALAVPSPVVRALLWSFVLPSYLTVLANLNPLLEYDGYYVLSDLLERPNLRADALAWVGSRFPHLLRNRADLRRHRVEFLYGVGSVLYIAVAAFAMLVLYRLALRGWIESILPASAAATLAWVFVVLVSVLSTLGLIADLRRRRTGAFGGPTP